jgi:hypothetical protein
MTLLPSPYSIIVMLSIQNVSHNIASSESSRVLLLFYAK